MADLAVAQVVPCNVERIPLHHWCPGRRLLAVGDRDGPRFDGAADPAAARTFRRPLDAALLDRAATAAGTSGWYAAWTESLAEPAGLDLLRAAGGDLVVGTAGFAAPPDLDALLAEAAAWLLLVGRRPGPQAARILAEGRHVEVLLGLNGAALPALPWEAARAVHLQPLQTGAVAGPTLEAWEDVARAALPAGSWVYDSRSSHTVCACGAVLVHRKGRASRLGAVDPDGRCRDCGRVAPLTGLTR